MRTFISILILFIAVFYFFYHDNKPKTKLTEIPSPSYDYIIVGAGSAGSVVASRLSENPNVTVLLLEAGGDDRDDERVSTPNLFGPLLDNAWAMYAETKAHASPQQQQEQQQQTHPQRDRLSLRSGMVLGGSSSVNCQVYARGSRHDFDLWSQLTGDETWNYDHVLPYFRKSEGVLDYDLKDSPYHGTKGPLSVSTHKNGWPIYDTIIRAFNEMDFPFNDDYNGERMEGVSFTQYNVANGERVSASKAFLHPVLDRPNLHVSINSYVHKILISDGVAYGVEMLKNHRKFIIKASKEVILSAGAIQSPKLLMLSGIGPKEVLDKHGIPVAVDLPVGKNLQNHAMVEVPISVTEPLTGTASSFSSLSSYLLYKTLKTGFFATSDIDVVFHTSATSKAKKEDWPDIQIMFIGKPINSGFMRGFQFEEDIVEELGKQRDAHEFGFGCYPSVQRPESRGYVSITSDDPYDLPFVYSNHLSSKNDTELLILGVRICQTLVKTDTMTDVGAFLPDTMPLSLCEGEPFNSDDYWRCIFDKKPFAHYHPAGTCKMGAYDDPTAVLDSKLKVKGISGLRVVDASVMPTIVSANPHASVVMIGEKAADMIMGKTPLKDSTLCC